MTSAEHRNRQPRGVATGGQFATEAKGEAPAGLSLSGTRHPQTGRPFRLSMSGGPYGELTTIDLDPGDGPDIAHHLDAILSDGSMSGQDKDQQVFAALERAGIGVFADTPGNAWSTDEETEAELWDWVQANRDPEAVSTARPDTWVDKYDRNREAGHHTGQPLEFTIQPQVWTRRDELLAAGNPIEVDLAPALADNDTLRQRIGTDLQHGGITESDEAVIDALRKTGHTLPDGPWRIAPSVLDDQDVLEWMDDNPVWEPASGLPHPTGGYTRIEDSAQARANGGTQIVYYNAAGQMHREDGPAVIRTFGDHEDHQWAQNGNPVRADGPAKYRVHVPSGAVISEMWTDENGHAHREDGPAISGSDGSREWFHHGQPVHRVIPSDPLPEHLRVSVDGRIIQTTPTGL